MADDDEESRRWILVEQMARDMKAFGEAVMVLPAMSERLERVERTVDAMKSEQDVHRQILKEHSADLREIKEMVGGHDARIVKLEAARS